MQQTQTDSVFLKTGFRFTSELEGERSSGPFDCSVPAEGDLPRRAVDLKSKAKVFLAGFNLVDNYFGLDGIPILVAHCAIDRTDDLAAVHHHLTQKAGLGLEKAAQISSFKPDAIFAVSLCRHARGEDKLNTLEARSQSVESVSVVGG
jgi:hypothetical protein